jgi:hypothetical protein
MLYNEAVIDYLVYIGALQYVDVRLEVLIQPFLTCTALCYRRRLSPRTCALTLFGIVMTYGILPALRRVAVQ